MSSLRCLCALIVTASISSSGAAAWAGDPPPSESQAAGAAALTKPYAQGLVDRMVYLHPQILRLDIIERPPGESGNRVVASTLPAAIGEPPAQQGSQGCEASERNRVFRCVLDMYDTPGEVIGNVAISLRYYPGQEKKRLTDFAESVRDQLAETLPDQPTLLDEMTIAPKPGDSQAQCVILDVLSHHPDLMVLAMHVTRSGESVNKMIAINRPRFVGRTSEDIEAKLATNGNILVETFSKTHRMETHIPLLAANNTQVGSLATVYLYHSDAEVPGLLQKTLQVQQELKPMIRDLNWLYEPCQLQAGGGEALR